MNRPGVPQRPPPNPNTVMASQYRGGPFQQQQQYALPQQRGGGVMGQFPPLTAAQAAGHRAQAGQPPTREFDPNEFPALGAQNQQSQPTADPTALNGFGTPDRAGVLGSLAGPTHQTQQPGLMNLAQPRLQQAFAADDKRSFNLNPKQQQSNASIAAVWNAPAVPPGLHQNSANGVPSHAPQHHVGSTINAPPGMSLPYTQAQQHIQQPVSQHQSQQQLALGRDQQPIHSQVFANAAQGSPDARPSPQMPGTAQNTAAQGGLPQTPAQQILISPADRWGLMGLLALIKATDPDANLLAYGQDLGTMGMDMNAQTHISSSFITPWSDSSAAHSVEPDFHLPSCYNIHASPPNAAKAAAFSDETLFFMFYASPRDTLQEIAAQELYNRLWRYHKELRLWITKEAGSSPAQKMPGGEIGMYQFFDPENWERQRKEMQVMYADLEERAPQVPYGQQQQGQQQQQQSAPQAAPQPFQTPGQPQGAFGQQQTQSLQHMAALGGQQRYHGIGLTQVAGM